MVRPECTDQDQPLGKTKMKKIVLAAFAAAIAVPAAAAPGDTATDAGSATATIIAPITLTHTPGAALAFGTIIPDTAAAGSVTVTAAGAGSDDGTATLVAGSVNTADSFDVTGDPSRLFDITTTGGTVSNGTQTMIFETSPSVGSAIISAGGTSAFTVGGTLSVDAAQAAGDYTGTYDATVTYN